MKIILLIAVTVTILVGYAFSHIVSERLAAARRPGSATTQPETSFFCDLAALTPEQHKRQTKLNQDLRSSILSVRELPDGFEFEFPSEPSSYQALAELTPLEHACCPFFDICIRLEQEGGKLWWRLTGREGAKQFIRAEFSPWIK
jgi:hypothetical protein